VGYETVKRRFLAQQVEHPDELAVEEHRGVRSIALEFKANHAARLRVLAICITNER
jgi:hypothetical protein